MGEVKRIQAEVESTLHGDPWHGPSVMKLLQGIDSSMAAAKPIPHSHSIWELTLHMTSWANETARRLRGAPHGDPEEGDWPAVAGTRQENWAAALARLETSHDALRAALAELADGDLHRQIAGNQLDGLGVPVTLYRTIIGVLQHDAYHAGQIALLKKAMSSPEHRSA